MRRSLEQQEKKEPESQRQTLKFIMKCVMLPFGMACDVISRLQDKAHELCHIKGVVGKLWMIPEGWMVTLREVMDSSVYIKMWVFRVGDREMT